MVVRMVTVGRGVSGSRNGRVHLSGEDVAELESWLAVGLAMIVGFLDGYGIITYNTYLSFMSGNTTQAGYRIGQGHLAAAVHSALAVVFFVLGSFAGALLAHSAVRRIRRLVFGVVAASLALTVTYVQFGFSSEWIPIAVLSFAMAAMNTALPRIGVQNVSLAFVTGTLSRIGAQLALAVRRAPIPDSKGSWDTHLYRTVLMAGIWFGFLAGALLSGMVTPHFGVRVLLFPILILSVLAALDRGTAAV